jgi:hypothetical protein
VFSSDLGFFTTACTELTCLTDSMSQGDGQLGSTGRPIDANLDVDERLHQVFVVGRYVTPGYKVRRNL